MKPLQSTVMPGATGDGRLRVATYNIHKGVRGVGPGRRLEIHNLCRAVEAFEADVICLQEVRHVHRGDARRFDRSRFGWPEQGQAEFLAPDGYSVAYRTNAYTKAGEHGNALLSRWPIGDIGHQDVSDHRFEQRGLLWVPVHWPGGALNVIVAHFGLSHTSRLRQAQRLGTFVEQHLDPAVPLLVAGDFNDWGERLDIPMHGAGLRRAVAPAGAGAGSQRTLTFPSIAPVFALDRIYTRGLRCLTTFVPRGATWVRMSDHLPLVAEFEVS